MTLFIQSLTFMPDPVSQGRTVTGAGGSDALPLPGPTTG